MNKILRVFLETDMRSQHDGLIKVAKAQKVDLTSVNMGEHVLFINRKMDRIKLYSSSGVLSYFRSTKGRLSLHVIEQIPRCFDAKGKINWDQAERLALDKQLKTGKKDLQP